MAAFNPETTYAQVQRGMRAGLELELVATKIAERREKLIADVIAKYRSLKPETKLTEREAMNFVVALSENAQLTEDLLHERTAGDRAAKRLQTE